MVCAGNHSLSECPKEKVCCAGCGQEHAASYGGCVKAKVAREVESTRVNGGITYSKAVKRVSRRADHQGITYSEAVQKVAKGRE